MAENTIKLPDAGKFLILSKSLKELLSSWQLNSYFNGDTLRLTCDYGCLYVEHDGPMIHVPEFQGFHSEIPMAAIFNLQSILEYLPEQPLTVKINGNWIKVEITL